jgi:predicted nuclease with TOPRIM domain
MADTPFDAEAKYRQLDDDVRFIHRRLGEVVATQQTHTDQLVRLDAGQRAHDERLGRVEGELAAVRSDVAGLKTDVADLKTDVADLKNDVADLKTDMSEVKGTLREIVGLLRDPRD